MTLSFCGQLIRPDDNTTLSSESERGMFHNECFVDGLSLIPAIGFLLVTLPIIMAWVKSQVGSVHAKTWVHFPGHICRWTLTLILIFWHILQITEGAVTDAIYHGGRLHLYIPYLIMIVATAMTAFYAHHAEMWNSPRYLFGLIAYWCSCAIVDILKLASLGTIGLGIGHIRLVFTIVVFLIHLSLLATEIYVLCTLRYAFFPEPRLVRPPDELLATNYYQDYVNVLSRATFFWINRFIMYGFRRPISSEQLSQMPQTELAMFNFQQFHKSYAEEKKNSVAYKRGLSMLRCYFSACKPGILLGALLRLIADLIAVFIIVVLYYLIIGLTRMSEESNANNETASETTTVGYSYENRETVTIITSEQPKQILYVSVSAFFVNPFALSVLLFVLMLVQSILLQQHHHIMIQEGLRLRAALQVMVYQKTLSLPAQYLAHTEGVVSLLCSHLLVDSHNVMMATFLSHFVWSLPLQILIYVTSLYVLLGSSALAGCLVIVVFCPIQFLMGRSQSSVNNGQTNYNETRIEKMKELLEKIKWIKLYSWPKIFIDQINTYRRQQLMYVYKSNVVIAVTVFLNEGVPLVAILLTFVVYVRNETEPLTAAQVFPAVLLYDMLSAVLYLVPLMIDTLLANKHSSSRLADLFAIKSSYSKSYDQHHARDTVVELCLDNCDGTTPTEILINDWSQGSNKGYNSHKPSQIYHGPNQIPNQAQPLLAEHSNSSGSSASAHGNKRPATLTMSNENEAIPMSNMDERSSKLSPSPTIDGNCTGVNLPDCRCTKPEVRGHVCRQLSTTTFGSGLDDDDLIDPERGLGIAVEVCGGTFSWAEGGDASLDDVMFNAEAGKLSIIIGQDNSGKSSLLAAMLGEMHKSEGSVIWKPGSTVAFVSQVPWLLNTSLRENILFGRPFEKKRYKRVLRACALNPDINILPAQDNTVVGSQGLELSLGMQQRLCVARAFYSRADIVLMDEPFSELDIAMTSHVFEDGILRFMLRRKRTVILATKHLHLLKFADKIVQMTDGKAMTLGNLVNMQESHPELFEKWQLTIEVARLDSEKKYKKGEDSQAVCERRSLHRQVTTCQFKRQHSTQSYTQGSPISEADKPYSSPKRVFFGRQVSHISEADSEGNYTPLTANNGVNEKLAKLGLEDDDSPNMAEPEEHLLVKEKQYYMSEDEQTRSDVTIDLCRSLLQMPGIIILVALVVSLLFRHCLRVGADFWLTRWTDEFDASSYNSTKGPLITDSSIHFYLRGYLCLMCAYIVFVLAGSVIFHYIMYQCAYYVHDSALYQLVHTSMRYFDKMSLVQILSRYTYDVTIMDSKMAGTLWLLCYSLVLVLSLAVAVFSFISPLLFFAILPLFLLVGFLQLAFRRTARQLQRLENHTRAPIINQMAETLQGLVTLRAYREQSRYCHSMLQKIDEHNNILLWLNTAHRWLGLRLDGIGAVFVLIVALTASSLCVQGSINHSVAALGIVYAMFVCSHFSWIVRNLCDTELYMSSASRLVEHTQLMHEDETGKNRDAIINSWPTRGHLIYRQVTLTYDEDENSVVHEVNFRCSPSQKLGICGKANSGKSTLVMGLFQMVELCHGQIILDDLDISEIPSDVLRSRLSMVPQDPPIFAGTIRFNLDPEGQRSDIDLYQSLSVVYLEDDVRSAEIQLDTPIDLWKNDSHGEEWKVLICLARAYLRSPTLLVVDEAMSTMQKSAPVMAAIKHGFKNATVIMINHDPRALVQCDKVLVLEGGRIVERGCPRELLADESSTLATLLPQGFDSGESLELPPTPVREQLPSAPLHEMLPPTNNGLPPSTPEYVKMADQIVQQVMEQAQICMREILSQERVVEGQETQKSCRFNDEPITVRTPSIEHTDSVEDDEQDNIVDDNHRNEENHGEENHDEENSDIYPPPPEIKTVHSDGSDDDDDMYGDGAVSREEEDIDGDCGGVSILVTQASPSDDSTDSM